MPVRIIDRLIDVRGQPIVTVPKHYKLLRPLGLGNDNDYILNEMDGNYIGFNGIFTPVAAADTGTEIK